MFFNDLILDHILSYLNLRQKSKLISVSRQFTSVVVKQLASVTVKDIIITTQKTRHHKTCDQIKHFDIRLIGSFSSTTSETVFRLEQLKQLYEPLIKQLKSLKKVKICAQCANEQLFQWICHSFPTIKIIIFLQPNSKKSWNSQWLQTVKRHFSANLDFLSIKNFTEQEIQDICSTELISSLKLDNLVIENCDSIAKCTELFLHLPKTMTKFRLFSDSGLTSRKLKFIVDRIGSNLRFLSIALGEDCQESFDIICDYCQLLVKLELSCDGLAHLEPIEDLQKLRILKVDLRGGKIVKLEDSRNKSVKSIIICGLLTLEPESMKSFAINYPKLIRLSIVGVSISCTQSWQLNCFACYQQFLKIVSNQLWVNHHNKWLLPVNLTFKTDNRIPRHERFILLAVMREFMASKQFYFVKVNYKQFSDFVDLVVDLIAMTFLFPELSPSNKNHCKIYLVLYDSQLYRSFHSFNNLFPENLVLVQERPQKKKNEEKRIVMAVMYDQIQFIGCKGTSILFSLNV